MTELPRSDADREPDPEPDPELNPEPYADRDGPVAELDADNEAEVNEALEDHDIPALPDAVPTEGGAGPP